MFLLGNLERQLMKTEKLFTVAGTAAHKGVTKVRFANDMVARIKILNKAGCTNINLVELPRPMNKLDAVRYLSEQGITQGDAGFAVSNKLAEKSRVAKSSEVRVRASKPAKPAKTHKSVTAQELVEAATAA